MDASQLSFTVVATTALILVIGGVVVVLVVMNNTRRIRHRAELAEMQQQQGRAVREAERETTRQTLQELGRELHDNVGQLLAVARMGLNTTLEQGPPHPVIQASRDALEQAMDEVRRLAHDLHSDLWNDRSLFDAIRAQAERVERVARVRVELRLEGAPPPCRPTRPPCCSGCSTSSWPMHCGIAGPTASPSRSTPRRGSHSPWPTTAGDSTRNASPPTRDF